MSVHLRTPVQTRGARKTDREYALRINAPPAGYFRGRAGSIPVMAQHATPGGSSHGSQRGFRASHRPVPAGAAGALLPDAGLGPRCRRPGPGDHAPRVAVLRRLRGAFVVADVAVPDRDQLLP